MLKTLENLSLSKSTEILYKNKLWLSWAKLKLSLVRVVDEVIVILDFV